MHTAPNQKLLEFIRRLRADLTSSGSITRFELYHSIEGGLGERLCTIEMADRDDDEDPDDLAQEVWNEAEEDAATRPTGAVERYTIQAFRSDTREPDEQKSFTTLGKLTSALTGNGTEPPTHLGMLAADMRQKNDLHSLVVRMCEATAGSAAVQLQREREENNRLRETAFEYEKLRQQMLDKTLERDLARQDAQASQDQNRLIFGALAQLAPIVLARLLSPPAPVGAAMPLQPQPAAPTAPPTQPGAPAAPPNLAAMAKLFESITPAQMQTLMATLGPEQVQEFLAIYTSFRDQSPGPSPASN